MWQISGILNNRATELIISGMMITDDLRAKYPVTT